VNLFKQVGSLVKIDHREVILLDRQSAMDSFCNVALVIKTCKSTTSMRLKRNCCTMVVTRKATMPGYNRDVWFITRSITNIIALSNLIQQYRVTYDSDDTMVVVHRQSQGKSNMEFHMHKCELHYYNPRNEKHLAFVNSVSENKEGFKKRHIKGAELAHTLYKTLSYPSMKDFKWVIRCNNIKDCPVIVQDIDVALEIWDKNIATLKGNTTRRKMIPVVRDFVVVPLELNKPFKELFLTTDIFLGIRIRSA
jgi:hypothetical protein